MDVNRKAHPDCRYSSNPFHECASDCLEKISQGRGNKHSKKQGTFTMFDPLISEYASVVMDKICLCLSLCIASRIILGGLFVI